MARERANRLLARAGVVVKRERVRIWDVVDYTIRYARRFGRREGYLFFRTTGCRHDAAGGCTMCDYSAGSETSATQMWDAVRRGMAELPHDLDFLKVTPSGSFLDHHEVPVRARRVILELLRASPYPVVGFESRAETLADEVLAQCREAVAGHRLRVLVGVESADPWVARNCINKGLAREAVVSGMAALRRHDIDSCVNVLLGPPFLSEAERIEDTVASVRWSLQVGAGEVCVYPAHVKRSTIVGWLHRQGLYETPSLWSLVEVLRRLRPEIEASRVRINWYEAGQAFNVVASPTTCDACRERIVEHLRGFAETNDFSCIERASAVECACRERWGARNAAEGSSREERAETAYRALGEGLVSDWWRGNGESVLRAVREDAVACAQRPAPVGLHEMR